MWLSRQVRAGQNSETPQSPWNAWRCHKWPCVERCKIERVADVPIITRSLSGGPAGAPRGQRPIAFAVVSIARNSTDAKCFTLASINSTEPLPHGSDVSGTEVKIVRQRKSRQRRCDGSQKQSNQSRLFSSEVPMSQPRGRFTSGAMLIVRSRRGQHRWIKRIDAGGPRESAMVRHSVPTEGKTLRCAIYTRIQLN
jgi:hypothetical protein